MHTATQPTFARRMDELRCAINASLSSGVTLGGVELSAATCCVNVMQQGDKARFMCAINYGKGKYSATTAIMHFSDYGVDTHGIPRLRDGILCDLAGEIRYLVEQDFVRQAIEGQGDCIGKFSPSAKRSCSVMYAANYLIDVRFNGGGYVVLELHVVSRLREELSFFIVGALTRYTVEGAPVQELPLKEIKVDAQGILDLAGATQPWAICAAMFYGNSRYDRA